MTQLSPQQYSVFDRAITIFRPSRGVLSQANALLRGYLEQEPVSPEMMGNMAEIAAFVAQSSQEVRDLKGRKISGLGLTFSRLIGNCESIPLLIEQTSKFMSVVRIENQSKLEIENYILKAKSTYESMQLFESYISKLQLVTSENISNIKYKDIFVELAWILYTDAREICIRSDFEAKEENNCLMASVFYFMIRYSLDYIYPKGLKLDRNAEKRVIIAKILEFLLVTFQIEQVELYMKVADKFDEYVDRLINCQIMKSVGFETDFFSPVIIHLNFKQLQNKYQKRLQPKDIDYRVFRKEKCLTPIHKEALFHRAGIKKFPALSKSMTTEYRSHRTLNYEELESPKDQRDKLKSKANPEAPSLRANQELHRKNIAELRPHNCNSTSLLIKPSTAIPEGIDLELYRYVNCLTKASKRSHKSLFYEKSLSLIQGFLARTDLSLFEVNKKSLLFTVYSTYVSLSEKIFEYEQETESMHAPLIAIALYIGLQMHHSIDNEKSICDIFSGMKNTNFIDLWHCLNFFMLSDTNLPHKLAHSYEMEQEKVICTEIWKNNSYIDEVAELAANYQKNSKFVAFTESLIEYCENFLREMGNELQISHEHCLYAYNCIKFILSANGNVLENQNIDQILMCSLYISGKTLNSPILFASIKEAYEILYRVKNRNLEEIFNKVTLSENGAGDIIYFYNKHFIDNIKLFVPYMANPSLSLLHPLFQKQIKFQKDHPRSVINIMQTTKPKIKKPKNKNNQEKNDGLGIIIQAERNETRVRIRPHSSIQTQLCDTEKINKIIDSEEDDNYE